MKSSLNLRSMFAVRAWINGSGPDPDDVEILRCHALRDECDLSADDLPWLIVRA